MTITTIALAIARVFGGDLATFGSSTPKDVLERKAGKAAEALPAIVGTVVGAILSFLGKAFWIWEKGKGKWNATRKKKKKKREYKKGKKRKGNAEGKRKKIVNRERKKGQSEG